VEVHPSVFRGDPDQATTREIGQDNSHDCHNHQKTEALETEICLGFRTATAFTWRVRCDPNSKVAQVPVAVVHVRPILSFKKMKLLMLRGGLKIFLNRK
jgi:hypothetical protein